MNQEPQENKIEQAIELGELTDFDQQYFETLNESWIALDQKEYENQKYFTGLSTAGEKVGIVGVYDFGQDQNILHYVVDPRYRGQRLAGKLTEQIMNKLNLPFVTLTIDLDNEKSMRAAEKMPGIELLSSPQYEAAYHKRKYRLKRPEKDNLREEEIKKN